MAVVAQLQRAWMNERCAPELLPFEGDAYEAVLALVKDQEQELDRPIPNQSYALPNMLRRMDVDRVKFLLRAYLRTRMTKIERYAVFLLKHPEMRARMAQVELAYARRYMDAVEASLRASCLSDMPARLTALDEEGTDVNMVLAPPMDTPAFCRVITDVGEFSLDDGDEEIPMVAGDTYALPYHSVRPLLASGRVELL